MGMLYKDGFKRCSTATSETVYHQYDSYFVKFKSPLLPQALRIH